MSHDTPLLTMITCAKLRGVPTPPISRRRNLFPRVCCMVESRALGKLVLSLFFNFKFSKINSFFFSFYNSKMYIFIHEFEKIKDTQKKPRKPGSFSLFINDLATIQH